MKTIKIMVLLFFCNVCYTYAQQNEFLGKALQYKQKENYVEALKNITKAIDQDPNNTALKVELADISYLKKSYFDAIPAYEALIKTDENPLYIARLAEMYSMSTQKGKALELANTAMKLKSKDEQVMLSLAKAFYEVKHYGNAIKMYEQIQTVSNGEKKYNYKIAQSYNKLKNSIAAVPYYEKSILDEPTNAQRVFEAANNCYDASNYNRAVELYQMAETKGFPKSKNLYEVWGNTYMEMKQFDKAIETYTKAKDYAPLDREINFNISDAHTAKGNLSKAREILEEMLEINPKDAEVLYAIGMTYYSAGQTGKAEKYFFQAFDIDPSLKANRYTKGGL